MDMGIRFQFQFSDQCQPSGRQFLAWLTCKTAKSSAQPEKRISGV